MGKNLGNGISAESENWRMRPSKRLIKTLSASEYLGVSYWKLRQMILKGELPYIQHSENGPFLLDIQDLDLYIERNKKSGHGFPF